MLRFKAPVSGCRFKQTVRASWGIAQVLPEGGDSPAALPGAPCSAGPQSSTERLELRGQPTARPSRGTGHRATWLPRFLSVFS